MASSSKLSMKLLIDQTANRVVFAEAGKATIDFLFSILTLPVGTVLGLLLKESMVDSLANLYKSVEDLDEEYVLPNLNKDVLLKPNTCISTQDVPLFALTNSNKPKKIRRRLQFYVCSRSTSNGMGNNQFHAFVTADPKIPCPCAYCNHCYRASMNMEVNLLGDIWEKTVNVGCGFVKGSVTYMVMDELVVEPMSTISSVALLEKLNVKDVDALDEKVVDLNLDMGLRLLETSFYSNEVLTSVFLRQEDPSVVDA